MRDVVVVTGGNRGLGLEASRQLAERGALVVLTGRDGDAVFAAPRDLARAGLAVDHAVHDVADAASALQLAETVRERHGGMSVLVNNAAVALDGFNVQVARHTIDINVHGVVRTTEALAPLVRDGGRIVMVSSGSGTLDHLGPELQRRFMQELDAEGVLALCEEFVAAVAAGSHAGAGWPSSAYSVSKAAVNALTRHYARALRDRGVLVNAVCPGWVRTRMGGRSAPRDASEGASGIIWAALLDETGPTGGFFRDREPIDW
jgi:NAD(P)-dependent dehydrogenase (short-subunit alcohol dehydrogenase family)